MPSLANKGAEYESQDFAEMFYWCRWKPLQR